MNTVITDCFGAVITPGCKLAWASERYGICYGIVKRVTFTLKYGNKMHTSVAIKFKGPHAQNIYCRRNRSTVVLYNTKNTMVLRDDGYSHL